MDNILNNLSDAQREAALQIDGTSIIFAGAGSGKTRTITHKIAYMCSIGIDPSSILAITFTNKAANEMKERIHSLVGDTSEEITAKTFHSFCAQIIREEYLEVGLQKNFTICDESDQKKIIKKLLKKSSYTYLEYEEVLNYISDNKNNLVDFSMVAADSETVNDAELALFYKEYQETLINQNCADFDDLLLLALKALQNADIRNKWSDRFQYVFVDEFQDTNKAQFELTKLISKKYNNLCVVGDDYQAIYGWRGSNVDYIINFNKYFPDSTTYMLDINYRSTPNIIKSANNIMTLNQNKVEKNLVANRKNNKHKVYTIETENEYTEAEYIAVSIKKYLKEGMNPSNIAILYRSNHQSYALEDVLSEYNISFNVVNKINFYSRKEIKDILSFLSCLYNTSDNTSFERIFNFPPRGFGDKTLTDVVHTAVKHKISLYDAASINDKTRDFWLQLEQCKADTVSKTMSNIINTFNIVEYWNNKSIEGDNDRVANINRLLTIAARYDNKSYEDFIEYIHLNSDSTSLKKDAVQLMTIHGSKGLEFKIVYLSGAAEGVLPLPSYKFEERDEERRLFYVAMTRAEDILFITSPKQRTLYGKKERYFKSKVLNLIPKKYVRSVYGS